MNHLYDLGSRKKESMKEGLAARLQKLVVLDASVDDIGPCLVELPRYSTEPTISLD